MKTTSSRLACWFGSIPDGWLKFGGYETDDHERGFKAAGQRVLLGVAGCAEKNGVGVMEKMKELAWAVNKSVRGQRSMMDTYRTSTLYNRKLRCN